MDHQGLTRLAILSLESRALRRRAAALDAERDVLAARLGLGATPKPTPEEDPDGLTLDELACLAVSPDDEADEDVDMAMEALDEVLAGRGPVPIPGRAGAAETVWGTFRIS
jgi:hypothetical protein